MNATPDRIHPIFDRIHAIREHMNLAWRTVNGIFDRMNLGWRTVNAIAGHMNLASRTVNAIRDRIHATASHMNAAGDRSHATADRMNLAWRLVNETRRHRFAIYANVVSPHALGRRAIAPTNPALQPIFRRTAYPARAPGPGRCLLRRLFDVPIRRALPTKV